MSLHAIILAILIPVAVGVAILAGWLLWNRRRIRLALARIEALDIKGARDHLHMVAENNDHEHRKQQELLKSVDGRLRFMQAESIADELAQQKAAEIAAAALRQEKAERGEITELPKDIPVVEDAISKTNPSKEDIRP